MLCCGAANLKDADNDNVYKHTRSAACIDSLIEVVCAINLPHDVWKYSGSRTRASADS